MNKTGFMPNRGRIITACYFCLDLKQDWRFGAHYFEEMLIDHDTFSNFNGWQWPAGISPNSNRLQPQKFNVIHESEKFDPEGEYIKTWVSELKKVPVDYIHDPWNLSKSI